VDKAEALRILGRRIRTRRGKMPQQRLAALSGLELGSISRIERGVVDPRFGHVLAIANALEMPLHELFDGFEGPLEPVRHADRELADLRRELTRALAGAQAHADAAVLAMTRTAQALASIERPGLS
jgi:transcriptional regulator with XRE-family HTH domain